MKLDPYIIAYTKVSTRWTKDLNVKAWSHETWRKLIGGDVLDINLGDYFLNLTLKAKVTKAKINKWAKQNKKVTGTILGGIFWMLSMSCKCLLGIQTSDWAMPSAKSLHLRWILNCTWKMSRLWDWELNTRQSECH